MQTDDLHAFRARVQRQRDREDTQQLIAHGVILACLAGALLTVYFGWFR